MSDLETRHLPFSIEQLPTGWLACPLGDVAIEIQTGFASGEHNSVGTGVPHLRPMNVSPDGKIDLTETRFVDSAQGEQRLRQGDVLFNNTNSPAWVGKTALVDSTDELAFSNHMTRLRLSSVVVPALVATQLQFLCRTGYFQHQCKKHVNQASISRTFLAESTPLLVPPLPEQERIVAKIEALQARSDAAKQALDAIPPLLEKLRQSVLAAAFRGDLTRAWRDAHPDVEPASTLLERIRAERRRTWEAANPKKKYQEPEPVDAEGLPELPEGWCWAWLTDCGEVARGKSKHRPRNDPRLFGDKYPFIQTGDVARSTGRITTATTYYSDFGLAQSRLFPTGTVCITIAANIADSAVLDLPACFPDSVVGVIPDTGLLSSDFIELYIRTVRDDLEAVAPATAQKNINLAVLSQVAVPVPPTLERMAIERILKAGLDFVATVSQKHSDVTALQSCLTQSILAKAFRGELVPQDPNDEPASALLDRIRAAREATAAPKRTTTRARKPTAAR